jgi:hypothetical protein
LWWLTRKINWNDWIAESRPHPPSPRSSLSAKSKGATVIEEVDVAAIERRSRTIKVLLSTSAIVGAGAAAAYYYDRVADCELSILPHAFYDVRKAHVFYPFFFYVAGF